MTTQTAYRLTQYAARRRLRLQDPARRARGRGRGPSAGPGRSIRPASCSSASTTATTPRWCGSTAASRWSPPPTSSPRSSTTPTTGAGSPPPTRCPTSTRWVVAPSSRSTCWAGRATSCRSSWSARCCAAGSTSPGPRAATVAGGHSIDDPEPKYGMAVTGVADPDRLMRNDAGRAGHAAVADQAARARRAQQPAQGHRRGLPAGDRDDDDAQPRRRARPRCAAGRRGLPPT